MSIPVPCGSLISIIFRFQHFELVLIQVLGTGIGSFNKGILVKYEHSVISSKDV